MNNKWTVALTALGLVSVASVAQAEEAASSVLTSLSSTTLSGYVDTSAHWNLGTGNENFAPYKFNNANKADGFNLNVVQLRLEKALDESDWAAGYRFDLWAGPDANALNTQSSGLGSGGDLAIRQAYVALRAPVGNGLDLKMGVFDSIIGYESVEAGNNPNYTRSYGHTLEPQTHTGLLASYRFCDMFSASAGVANTTGSTINERAFNPQDIGSNGRAESYKTYMGSVAVTAPESLGFLQGSTLYAGVVSGFNGSAAGTGFGLPTQSYYIGATIATPVTGLRLGAAWDLLDANTSYSGIDVNADVNTLAGYASFQATEKLSLHGRFEWVHLDSDQPFGVHNEVYSTTGTVQYDLWANVLTRLEFRWDHMDQGEAFGASDAGGNATRANAFLVALNVIYKF